MTEGETESSNGSNRSWPIWCPAPHGPDIKGATEAHPIRTRPAPEQQAFHTNAPHAAQKGRRPAGSQERNTTMTATSVTEHHAPTGPAHNTVGHESAGQDAFSTDITGLPGSVPTPTVQLSDGAVYDLRVAPVTKQIGDATVRMLAYNGSIPGPTLRVRQGTEVVVNAANDGDLETTVHWHGLRLDNRFDGTHHTQDPIETGGAFGYRISFPDPGVYWYHPHIRQDYGQEMGLYGTIVVEPTDPDYWPPVNREITLTLDDILLTDGAVAPFSRTQTTHTAMGRFGDVLLVNGDPDLKLTARAGEVVRFYLVNTANTRVFNVAIPGARMKLVGGDSGRYEHEQFVESVGVGPLRAGRRRRAVHRTRDSDRWSTTPPTGSTRWPRSPSPQSTSHPT